MVRLRDMAAHSTSKKQADARRYTDELRESELRFQNLADTAPMYIAMADSTGSATYFNKPWLEFTGKSLKEMRGLGWLSVLHPEDAPVFEKDFKHAFAQRISISEQYRFRRADGQYRWMQAVGAPRFTPSGEFIGYFGTYNDFHDLKEAQLAHKRSEERYKLLFNSINQGFCVIEVLFDADGKASDYRFLQVNKVFNKQTGLKNVLGKTMRQLAPHHEERWFEVYGNVALTGESISFEDEAKALGRVFEVYAFPFGAPNERMVAILFSDITERKKLEAQREMERRMQLLTDQHNALLKVNKTKDEFIGLASHQLRTPATAVKQYIGLLLQQFAGPLNDKQMQYLQIAYDSNERELGIINDLLKTAQLDASAHTLFKQPYNLVALVNECLSDMQSTFSLRNQEAVIQSAKDTIMAPVDMIEMKLVFINLLENASKYSHPDSVIKLDVLQKGKRVYVSITDEGVGISEENRGRIFEKFTRIDNELSDTVTGTGLGLYWVKQIVGMHNGTVKLISKPGEGSTFTVALPVANSERHTNV